MQSEYRPLWHVNVGTRAGRAPTTLFDVNRISLCDAWCDCTLPQARSALYASCLSCCVACLLMHLLDLPCRTYRLSVAFVGQCKVVHRDGIASDVL
jgi:hypothetical protein